MKRLHLICTAHIDPVWQWTFDEGISAALSTFKSAIELAEEFDYIFCHNESLLYQAIEDNCPELFEKIKMLVKKGKWKITGGWYVQPDCLMPSGESIVRQIKTGEEYFAKKFGVKPQIATNFDTFGHSRGLVQILAKNGYKGYIFCRPHVWDNITYPEGRFWKWTSDTGESVIITRRQSYGSVMGEVAQKIKSESENSNDVDYVLWGVGNHGGGPSRKDLKDILELMQSGMPIEHSCPEALFSDDIKVDSEIKKSLVTCMAGCYSSMAKIKQSHREAENLLYSTEKMLAVASMSGYKADLTALKEAQKKLLLAEFHDVLPGSCIEGGEKEGLELLSACKSVVRDYRTKAFNYLAINQERAKEGEFPIYVFNPNPYQLTVPIEAEYILPNQNWSYDFRYYTRVFDGDKEIDCQEIKEESCLNLDWRKKVVFNGELKPLSVTRFSIYAQKGEYAPKYLQESRPIDLKEFLKGSNVEQGVELEMFLDNADPWGMTSDDLHGIGKDPEPFDFMSKAEGKEFIQSKKEIDPVHLIEDGKVYTAVEAFYKKGKSSAVIEYRRYKQQKYTDIKVTVEFNEKNKCVKLKVPVPQGVTMGDGPFIIEEKPKDSEISFQKWLGIKEDDGQIYAVINNGVYAGKVDNGYLYLTLLRGAAYCMHPIQEDDGSFRVLYPEDRYLPRIDCGRYTFYLRIARGSVQEINALAEEFNQKPYAINIFPIGEKGHKADISTDVPVTMPAMKIGDNGGYVMRFFNPELAEKTFTLTVNGNNQKITMSKAEIVSVIYKEGKFTVCHDTIPV